MVSRFSSNKKTIVTLIFGDRGTAYFWQARFLPRWLPLLLGLALGLFLASLITNEAWPFPVLVAFLVPGIILFTRYPFIAVLVWMLVFPFFVRAPGAPGRYIYWLLHRAMIPVALGSVIVADWLGVSKRREPVRLGGPELALMIFLALVFANILVFSDNTTQDLFNLYDRSFVPVCMYLLVRLVAPAEEDLKRFLWVALFTVLIQSVIGLLSWFAPQTLPSYWLDKAGARTVGTFGNPAVYSSTLIFLSLLLFQRALNSQSARQRYLLYSVFALAFFCVFFTFSRGSWLGGSVVILALMLLYPKVIIRLMVVVVPLIVLLSSSVLAGQVAWAWERLNTEETAEGRIIGYNASIQMIQEKPLFGWGYGDYDLYSQRFKTRVLEVAVRGTTTSHNTYLTVMAETGLITFVFYIFPLFYWVLGSLKAWRWLPREGFWSRGLLLLLWLLMIDHIIVGNFMDMIRFNQFGTTVWWLAMGLIANMVYPHLQLGQVGTRWNWQPIR